MRENFEHLFFENCFKDKRNEDTITETRKDFKNYGILEEISIRKQNILKISKNLNI